MQASNKQVSEGMNQKGIGRRTVQYFKGYMPFYKRNLRLAFPVMMTQLGSALVGFFDTVMVGHYGTTELAAVSFSNSFYLMVMVFTMGLVMSVTPLVGTAFVQKKEDEVANLLHNGLVFTFIITIAACALLLACVPLLGYMGQEPEVIEKAVPYFVTITISLFPFIFFQFFKQFFEGIGNTMAAMCIMLSTNLLNILLNYLLIFGKWGFPEWGALGAGVASLIARILMPILFLAVFACRKEWSGYLRSFRWKNIRTSVMRQLAALGLPIGTQTLLETIAFAGSYIIVGWLSKEAMAAHQIGNQIANLTFMLAVGIGAATTVRVSHQYGLRDYKAVRMAANASIHLCLLMNAIGATLMISCRKIIPLAFTNDPAVIEIASSLLIFAGLFQLSDGLQCVGIAMLRGIQDVRRPALYAFIAYILLELPIGYILMFPCGLGANGMWIGFIIGLSVAAVLFHTRFRSQFRKIANS